MYVNGVWRLLFIYKSLERCSQSKDKQGSGVKILYESGESFLFTNP